ncbi:MAG: RNA-binding S4 domain-containing protein [Bacteroidetes bacterium]|nr:RNA-binding S4 domain-containing protein [Bacteroidota bacterium]
MKKTERFELIGHEFIELNKLLKFLGWVETGGEAKIRIEAGEVMVNEAVEFRKRCKLRVGDKVFFNGNEVVIG